MRASRPSLPVRGDAVGVAERSESTNPGSSQSAASTALTSDVLDWLDCERERRHLESELKRVVSTQEKARLHILERWSMDGTTQEKVDGLTVHLRKGLHPKIADPARLAIALREEGLTDLLTVDLQALKVWLEAHDDSGVPLSESLAALVGEPYERFALAVRLPGRLQ